MPTNDAISVTAQLLAQRAPTNAVLTADGQHLIVTTVEIPIGSTEVISKRTMFDIDSGIEEPAPINDSNIARYAPQGAPVSVSPNGQLMIITIGRGVVLDTSKPYRWTRPIRYFDAIADVEDPPQLQLVDISSGTKSWITQDEWRWSSVKWAPTGDRIVACRSLDPSGRDGNQYAHIIDMAGNITNLGLPGGRSVVATWLPDSRLAVLIASPADSPTGSQARLYIIDGSLVRLLDVAHLFGDVYGDQPAELADSYDNILLAADDGSLIVRTGSHGFHGIVRLHPDRPDSLETLIDGDRCCSPVAIGRDRDGDSTLIFTNQSATSPVELLTLNIDKHNDQHREIALTHFTPVDYRAPHVQRFTVATDDGFILDAWFMSAEPTVGPLATVTIIHGGPNFAYGETFSIDAHALCAAGFGVLYTNVRGSTGYGDAFAHASLGDWAHGPSRDQLLVIDRAIGLGLADGNRLGITGNSYGGYLSAWLASTTTRFKAAVIENPVIDLVAMSGTSDIGSAFFRKHFGDIAQGQLDLYYSQSPISQAHLCTTPCLFVIGEQDRRCPTSQAWSMHSSLIARDTVSEVLVLPNSSHEGSTYGPPLGRLAHNEALVDWMTKWL